MFDYVGSFPIPVEFLPQRLRSLLEPVGTDPLLKVEVNSFTETEIPGLNRETLHMLTAVVPDDGSAPPIIHSDQGLVAYSVPIFGDKGSLRDFIPSVCGYDYIVASWGSSLFYTYNLAEKVWMTLGLTPRCIGNEQQSMVYDDLSLPEFGVATGEVSCQYHCKASRNIRWFMSNEYLRKYLWMRGARGVRQFYYQATLQDVPQLRDLMKGESFVSLGEPGGWFDGDIREANGGLLLQIWATVEAISGDLCPQQTADELTWPGIAGKVTRAIANDIMRDERTVYLDDRFLERYEKNKLYGSTPVDFSGGWLCSPSYLGQWSFTGCQRVGRNLIEVELRDLYKGVPDREILHAHSCALDAAIVKQRDLTEEHIVSKVDRLLAQLLSLGENLSRLGAVLGIQKSAVDLLGFSRKEVKADGWLNYPQLSKLAQVAPLDMTQQDFLARCKSIHEIWQKLPNGFLKQILQAAGVPRESISNLASLKLLEGLLNILVAFDANWEAPDALKNKDEPEGWKARSTDIAMLFVTNDLRIADAHDSVSEILKKLQDQGFETATLHQGYGRALDFVLDGVIKAFAAINDPLGRILARA
jgi:hypothetical protein